VEHPEDLASLATLLKESRGATLRVEGGGSKGTWGPPPRVDRVIGMAAFDGVTHDAADMVAMVGAGARLAALQATLGQAGQWLALDPPHAATATVGGLFATNDHGPSRLAYGSLRELVIGMTYALVDGTVARSGSRVIKNVAGYDLCKLFAGSLGTLGVVTELIVRLHPRPAAHRTLRRPCDAAEAAELAERVRASPLEPVCLDHVDGALLLRLAGAGVDREMARAAALLGGEVVEDDATLWADVSEALGQGDVVVRIGSLPTALPPIEEAVAATCAGHAPRRSSHVALGLHTVALARGDGGLDRVARSLRALRDRVRGLGGWLVVRAAPPELFEHLDAFGPPPASAPIMRRVKAALDPEGRLAPGRMGGLLAGP
jgi:glycolate oxidase FAD binding subunit